MTLFFNYGPRPRYRIEITPSVVLVWSFRAHTYVNRFYGPEAVELAVAQYPRASFLRRK